MKLNVYNVYVPSYLQAREAQTARSRRVVGKLQAIGNLCFRLFIMIILIIFCINF